eukprot:CAMPEP_0185196528 /NCGR_PEP_ID=MMETSP1140-20130426/37762_1 /TAXON_ID=298111 /ORGANISM="Pavlova sp., Strain CCMP459" /LENGTH=63 /DNA_ID=CAMNT_0027763571 /DNA_START=79 /DNA_END=266 /DNA_ORIENTATION=-
MDLMVTYKLIPIWAHYLVHQALPRPKCAQTPHTRAEMGSIRQDSEILDETADKVAIGASLQPR